MDFSEIGVKSRKTGLKAKENVRRDEHNMEDVDDFFNEDPTITQRQHQQQNQQRQQLQPTRQQQQSNPNGRIIFPPSSNNVTNQTNLRNSPLLSPLPAHSNDRNDSTTADIFQNRHNNNNNNNNSDDSDQFDDAIENPQDIDNENNDYNDDNDDMEIDDESRGDIKMVDNDQHSFNQDFDASFGNNNVDDYNRVYAQPPSTHQQKTPKKQSLFVDPDDSSDYDDEENSNNGASKSYSQRQQELEKNLTIRSSARKGSNTNPTSRSSNHQSPVKSKITSTTTKPTPTSSTFSRPPSSKSISHLSKNIALNKNKPSTIRSKPRTPTQSSPNQQHTRHYSDNYDDKVLESVSETSSSDESIQPTLEPSMPSLPNDDDSGSDLPSDDSEEHVKVRRGRPKLSSLSQNNVNKEQPKGRAVVKRRGKPPKSPRSPNMGNGRVNKFKRNEPDSPSSREHIIDVKRLRKEQESRSQSRHQETTEQPTRRSSRVRIPPLAFWRNERAIYEKSRGEILPTLKKIITVDDKIDPLPSRPTSKAPSRNQSKIRSNGRNGYSSNPQTPGGRNRSLGRPRKQQHQPPPIFEDDEDEEEEEDVEDEIPQGTGSEWLKEGYLNIETFEGHGSDAKQNRLIAWGPGTETYTSQVKSATDNFKLAILFDKNRDFIATGMMLIPPGGVKSLKGTDTTYFVFYCISGIIEVTLSGTVFIIKKGCSLEIPMGNFYQFVNKGQKDASLFFVQTRGQVEDDEWDDGE